MRMRGRVMFKPPVPETHHTRSQSVFDERTVKIVWRHFSESCPLLHHSFKDDGYL